MEDRKRLRAKVETEKAALGTDGLRLTEKRAQEKEARSKVDALRDGVRRADAAVTKADEAVSRHRRVLGAAKRQAWLRELGGRYEKAQAAEKLQREAQQEAAAILVTDEAIKRIHAAARGLETIRSRLNAAATLISFEMTKDGISGIEINEEPLTADQPSVRVVEAVTITVPDRGRITVAPAIRDRDKLLRQQRDARTALREALGDAGARSAIDAEDQYTRRLDLLRNAELARQGAELHAPATADYKAGAQALADYIEGLRQVLKREMNELDLQALPAGRDAETALRTAQGQAEETHSALGRARAALRGPEDVLNGLQREIGHLQGRYDESEDRLKRLQVAVAQEEERRSDGELQSGIEAARTRLSEQETMVSTTS